MDNKIVLKPGVTWNNLPVAKVIHMIDVDQLHNQVIQMRNDWNTATQGNMKQVTVNLDMLFDDILQLLNGGE